MESTLAFEPEAHATARLAMLGLKNRVDPEAYGAELRVIGNCLASALLAADFDMPGSVAIGFTAEDSDWLAAGFLDRLGKTETSVACLWLASVNPYGVDWLEIAPVVQQYVEPSFRTADTLIVISSLIDESCAFMSGFDHILELCTPKQVVVVGAITTAEAWTRLQSRIESHTGSPGKCISVAINSEQQTSQSVRPSLGGRVHERLGFRTISEKNSYMPSLVKKRQEALFELARKETQGIGFND